MPSVIVKAGDVIAIRERSKKQLRINDALQLAEKVGFPSWVEVDAKKLRARSSGSRTAATSAQDINESLVVELYSR